jgi:hypothetical protein
MQFSFHLGSSLLKFHSCGLVKHHAGELGDTVEGRSDAKTIAACHDRLLTPLASEVAGDI